MISYGKSIQNIVELTPLEALQNIKILVNSVEYASKIPSFAEELDIIEKHIKALEIIKDCCIVAEYPVLEEENKYELAFCNKICISKEEYDLLKEVLE